MNVRADRLLFRWSQRENDWLINYPGNHRNAGGLIHSVFCHDVLHKVGAREGLSLVEELEARGYDLSTLRFQIDKKKGAHKDDDRS